MIEPKNPPPASIAEVLIVGLWLAVVFLVRRPGLVLGFAVGLAVWQAYGPSGLHFAGALVFGALLAWRLCWPGGFRRLVAEAFARRSRLHWYRRRWRHLLASHKLVVSPPGAIFYPRLRRVRCGSHLDRLHVELIAGITPEHFEEAAEALAHACGARAARVVVKEPGHIVLELGRLDALSEVVAPLEVSEPCDLFAVPVGIAEDGSHWRLRLAGSHILVVGVTGAGKGSVVWSLVRGIGPAIRDGLVQVWAVDPKGGMELAPGRSLFARFAASDFEEMADLFDDAVALMRLRAVRLAGVSRKHEPSVTDPLVVVLIDEVANLTAYLPDRKLRERMAQSVSVLLTQGRAVGVVVVAALQDPRKDVIAFRNLFPTKVALRLDEPSQIDMVLGDGARHRGARCDQIPESLPGVGYVRLDGVREPARVRASYVTDQDIAEMANNYAPRFLEYPAA